MVDNRQPQSPDVTVLSMGLLTIAFFLTVVKAWTAPFGYDEALSWELYIQHGFNQILTTHDENNHLLNTFLMEICGRLFGDSEFSLRLPALAGRLITLAGLYLLARDFIQNDWMRVSFLAVMGFHPTLLDWGMISQGYSLGLGFSLLACWTVFRAMRLGKPADETDLRKRYFLYLIASLLFGLAVVSVPIFAGMAIPLVAAVGLFVFLHPGLSSLKNDFTLRSRILLSIWSLFLLGIVAAVLCMVLYSHLAPAFSMPSGGAESPWGMYEDHIHEVLYIYPMNFGPLPASLVDFAGGFMISPGTMAVIAIVLLFVPLSATAIEPDWALGLLMIAVIGSLTLIIFNHVVLDFPYPIHRTSIYLFPLVVLLEFRAVEIGWRWLKSRAEPIGVYLVHGMGLLVMLLLMLFYFTKFNVQYHIHGRLSPAVTTPLKLIDAAQPNRSPDGGTVMLAHSSTVRPEITYYRHLYGMEYLDLVGLEMAVDEDIFADYYIWFDSDGIRMENVRVIRGFPEQSAYFGWRIYPSPREAENE